MLNTTLQRLGATDIIEIPDRVSDESLFQATISDRSRTIAFERVPSGSVAAMQAHLLRGQYRLRNAARQTNARPTVILGVARVSSRALGLFQKFAGSIYPIPDWIIINNEIIIATNIQELSMPARALSPRPDLKNSLRADSKLITGFSDTMLACVKALAFPHLNSKFYPTAFIEYLKKTRANWDVATTLIAPVLSIREIAMLANVSIPQVFRFAALYEKLGFVSRWREGLRLRNTQKLFDAWALHLSSRSRGPYFAKFNDATSADWIHRKGTRLRESADRPENTEICIALHTAADLLGYRAVTGVPISLYSNVSHNILFQLLDLLPCAPENATVWIYQPAMPNAVWRFKTSIKPDNFPVTDIIQTYLDLKRHPVRGVESAEKLYLALDPLIQQTNN